VDARDKRGHDGLNLRISSAGASVNDLIDKVTDVQQTLAYGRGKLNRYWLGLGLVCLAFGVGFAYLRPDTFDVFDWFMTIAAIALGGFMTAYAVYRIFVPGKPLVVISRAGVRLHIEWVKDIHIPWHEVRGVDTINISTRHRGHDIHYLGVTVFLVSRSFYDRCIHIDSWVLRGPGWEAMFIPKGDTVQVALHHEILPATAAELRTAVEVRWRAFRDATPRPSYLPQVPLRT
jgi:hypothetical protein